jgi:hypothetical protein
MHAQQIPEAWRSWFDERAAILEYDAGLSRAAAEEQALRCLQDWIRQSTAARAEHKE